MKKVLVLSLFCLIAQIFSITVDGYAFLEGETDHSGIEVFFQRVVPDTNYDYTVYTDSTGYYSAVVENGYYDVNYYKSFNFLADSLFAIDLYSSTTLEDVTLVSQNNLTGSIKGIIPAGSYDVLGTITVEQSDSLIIEPGVILNFHSDTEFMINGYLSAEGTEDDSIKFTSSDSSWNGLNFGVWSDNSTLDYCLIENSIQKGIYIPRDVAGIVISNSSITKNSNDYGVYISDCEDITIDNVLIDNNKGGIYTTGSNDITIGECIISNNTTSGGVQIRSSSVSLINCEISNNLSTSFGGGINVESNNSYFLMENTLINNNYSERYGGGMYLKNTKGRISNCIFYNNECNDSGGAIFHFSYFYFKYINVSIVSNSSNTGLGGGIYHSTSDQYQWEVPKIINCTIANNIGNGIQSTSDVTYPNVENCNVWGNTPNNFFNCGDFLGQNVTTNVNGDQCDPWYNISIDPKLNGDLTLQSDSPCIDAGTNTIDGYEFPLVDLAGNYRIWDGDGNSSEIVDMGAYEYGSPSGIDNGQFTIDNYSLLQNYPNPFNPETTISYSLMNNAQVQLRVFDILGREVAELIDSKQNIGLHEVKFDGSMLTSGIYFYRLSIDGKAVENRKMMLLK